MIENDITLVKPNIEFKIDALLYCDECVAIDGRVHGDGGLLNSSSYEAWLSHLQSMSDKTTVPEGLVPSTTYFAIDTKSRKIVGIIDIRHTLNDYLANRGGHIGYSVRPSLRGKGFGIAMLELALLKCTEIGLSEILITCDKDNIRSAKTAMHCGGREEITKKSQEEGFRRFWIKLA